MTATSSATFGDRDRRASWSATGRGNDPSIPESLLGRARGCFWWGGWQAATDEAVTVVSSHAWASRNRKPRGH